MASKHKIVEKFAQPIAEILYQRGFRKIDEMLGVVSLVITSCTRLTDEEKKYIIYDIENRLKEYQYD